MTDSASPRVPDRLLLGLFLGFAALLAAAGYALDRQQFGEIRKERHEDLSAISALKASQIAAWRHERLADARAIARGPFFAEALARWLHGPPDAGLATGIRSRLAVAREAYGYANVMLLAPDGRALLSLAPGEQAIEPEARQLAALAVERRDAIFGDLFRGASGKPRLDVAAPLLGPGGRTLAVLLLRTDPEKDLYPLLASWPTPSPTAETLLIRRDGEMVVFLHRLRHLAGEPLEIRKTVAKTQYVGARAGQGQVGVVEGIDYRQVPVLADLRPIPGSGWIMVAKVDQQEILAEARYRRVVTAGATLGGILLAGLLFAALATLQRQKAYAKLYRAERGRSDALEVSRAAAAALAASQRQLRLLFESVGDGIHVLDIHGNVSLENPAAIAMFGWGEGEMLGRKAHALVHHHDAAGREYPEEDCPILATMRDGSLRHVEGEVFFRKDGTPFPVEYTCAPVHDDSGAITGTVVSFRDVSPRRLAEEGLRRTQEALRNHAALLSNAQRIGLMGSWEVDVAGRRLTWSEETCALFGIAPAEFRGTIEHFRSFILSEDVAAYETMQSKVRQAGGMLEAEYRIRRPDGQVRWMYERGTAEYDAAGNELRRLGMVMDVTDRKRVERQQAWEAGVLEAVSSGEALGEVLTRIALGVEETIPGSIASILLLEGDGKRLRHGAAPHLPEAYIRAIDQQLVGPACGSCGTSVHRKERVIVTDIEADPLWERFRDIAREHRLRACWSVPVVASSGEVVASFAVYYREVRAPQLRDLDLVDRIARITAIAVERDRREKDLRASEERFRRTFLDAATGIAVTDLEGRYLDLNQAYCRMLGYTREELFALDLESVTYPDDWPANRDALAELASGRRESVLFEKRYRGKGGRMVWARVSVALARHESGPARLIGVAEDITDRKRAEQEIALLVEREREARARADDASRYYRSLFESAPGAYLVLTPGDFEIVAASEAYLQSTMTTREAISGRTLFEVFPDDPAEPDADGTRNLRASFERVKETGRADVMAVQRYPVRRPREEGGGFEERFWSTVNSPVFGPGGELAYIIHRAEDVTPYLRYKQAAGEGDDARLALATREAHVEADIVLRGQELTRANEELARNQALLRVASKVSRLGAWAVDLPGYELTWSDEVRAIHEYPAGRTPALAQAIDFYAPEFRDAIAEAFGACEREGVPYDLELQILTTASRRVWVRAMGEAVRDPSGRIVRVHGAIQDITQRKRAEQALRESEERFRLLSRATRDAIWDWDLVNDTVWWNEGFESLFGHQRDGRQNGDESWSSRIHPEDRDAVVSGIGAVIDGGRENWSDRYRFARRDGSWADVQDRGYVIRDAAGRAIRMVGAMTDITEQRALEEQLRQAQRLESVGQLTGGVAHDFNNLLTVILGNADLLEEALRHDARLLPLAEMIAGAASRGAELTRRLLAFARKQPLSPRAVDVNRLVASVDSLLRRALGEHIEIEFSPAADLRPALVDPGQLESALLNLCLNARDAMPAGGRLALATANVRVQPAAGEHRREPAGDYVLLSVADTGSGIAPEHIGRVFEPFFTTKPPGKGTGLGLAMVYGFAKQSGGHAEIASEFGRGTVVKLFLPCADAAEKPDAGDRPVDSVRGGDETILLVEDDALVQRHAVRQLTTLGYRVLVASHAREALGILCEQPDIDLLFTDVVMPGGMGGRDLADEALRLRPGLKVLYTSGYAQDAIVHDGRVDAGVQLLVKPYRGAELARKIREVLDGR